MGIHLLTATFFSADAEGTDVIQGRGVRAGRGQGHFHLEGRDQRVVGGAAPSLRLPPVLTQTAAQEEVLSGGFVFTHKTQQGILCRERGEANTELTTLYVTMYFKNCII